jgi:3-isopropylmalate/(R)-2-methylmalate dehydratase large subunit
MAAQTLFEKIWNSHVVVEQPDCPAVLYIDLHLVHEVTSPQAFQALRDQGLRVRQPSLTVATADHSIPTYDRSLPIADALAAKQIKQLEDNCREFGVPLHGLGSPYQGIVHVIGPELGLTQPGMTIVCGDSHTSTHGAFGALAFGIGTTEVEHVLATQSLLQRKPETFEIRVDGTLKPYVGAKDIILALIAKIGVGGGVGSVLEYTGSAIRALSMDGRMTICNMSIEGGAKAGMIAPDDVTIEYMSGRQFAPKGAAWDAAVKRWKALPTDTGAKYDKSVTLDAAAMEPMITYGTNPGMGIGITQPVPNTSDMPDESSRKALQHALEYMAIEPGKPLLGRSVDVVFIGSCTNSRISDLREAAKVIKGRKVNPSTRVLVVPGSQQVKKQAEAEGLPQIFREAGCEWREPGCSMCIAMNGDEVPAGKYAVSTSNRNFEGRQGKGSRSFLASPVTAAAAAVTGKVTDVRQLLS